MAERAFAEAVRDALTVVMERDPAVKSRTEAKLFSPGLHAIRLHRISHRLYTRGRHKSARAVNYVARVLTGADIHPGATIGRDFFIDHATGVVIGETAEIGDNVSVYQGAYIGQNCHISNAIIFPSVNIGDDVRINGGIISPKTNIKDNISIKDWKIHS